MAKGSIHREHGLWPPVWFLAISAVGATERVLLPLSARTQLGNGPIGVPPLQWAKIQGVSVLPPGLANYA